MKTRIKTLMIAAASILTLGTFVPVVEAGGCNTSPHRGLSINIGQGRGNSSYYQRSGNSSYYSVGNQYTGHTGSHRNVAPSYRETCQHIDTCYFNQGCYRYAKYTYLHRRIDCHGHVVGSWNTCKTVCVGRLH